MNPPFSVMAYVDGRMADAALCQVGSALARLADGGRLVAITGASFSPDNPTWRDAFVRLQERGCVVFSVAIDGSVYRSEEHTSELQSLMRISYAVFCLKKKTNEIPHQRQETH